MVRPIINSDTRRISHTPGTVGAASIVVIDVVIGVQSADANTATEVSSGTEVKAVFCEIWLVGDDAASGSFVLTCEKIVASSTEQTYGNSVALTSYPGKKNIFYTSQGLTSPVTGTPIPVVRQWVAVPKGKQRFGLGDRFVINLSGISNGINYCGQSVFKAYT